MAKRRELRPPVTLAAPSASGRSWAVPSWTPYIQSCSPLVDIVHCGRPLNFIVRGDASPCAGGSWTQLSIGLCKRGNHGRPPAYLWVNGMAVYGDKEMAPLGTYYWGQEFEAFGPCALH